ncbi:MAG: MFS transporter [Promethearchaeota archaeon]
MNEFDKDVNIKRRKFAKISGQLTILLFVLIMMLDFMDQNMLSPLLNPLLLDFFNDISKTVPLGWIQSVFTILSAISMVFAGILADRGSRKKICFIGSLTYSFFSIITIFCPSGQLGYTFFFITRALNGIGIGMIIPTIFSLLGDLADPKKRATVFGFINLAMIIGQMGGLILAGLLEGITGNWRIPYFFVGITNFILAFALIFIKEPKRGSQEEELKGLILEGAEYRFKLTKDDFKIMWTNKSNFWLIMNFIDCFPDGIIMFFIFKYMEDFHNVQENVMTIILLGALIFGGIGTVLIGILGDKMYQKDKRSKVLLALICNAFPVIFFIGFLLVDYTLPDNATIGEAFAIPQLTISATLLILLMFINQGVNPNWYSSLTDINLPEHRATMIGLANFMDMIGRSIGPLIGAYIADYFGGIMAAMWAGVGFWILNIVLWLPVFHYIKGDLENVHEILEKRAIEMNK